MAKEQARLSIFESYLPRPLTGEEFEALVNEAVRATGACPRREKGKGHGLPDARVAGRANGKVVSDLVRQTLDANA